MCSRLFRQSVVPLLLFWHLVPVTGVPCVALGLGLKEPGREVSDG